MTTVVRLLTLFPVLVIVNAGSVLFYYPSPLIPWKKGICKDEIQSIPKNFDPQRFFSGRWYDERNFGTIFANIYRRCINVDCTINGNIANITLTEYIPLIFSTISTRFQVNLTDPSSAKFMVNVPFLGIVLPIKIPVTIIGTDYENYAILYSCTNSEIFDGYISEISVVLRRKQVDRRFERELKRIVWKNGIKWEDYQLQDVSEC